MSCNSVLQIKLSLLSRRSVLLGHPLRPLLHLGLLQLIPPELVGGGWRGGGDRGGALSRAVGVGGHFGVYLYSQVAILKLSLGWLQNTLQATCLRLFSWKPPLRQPWFRLRDRIRRLSIAFDIVLLHPIFLKNTLKTSTCRLARYG